MNGWRQYNPVDIVSGIGSRACLAESLQNMPHALLVTTSGMLHRGTAQALRSLCPDTTWTSYTASPNPDLDTLDDAIVRLRHETPSGYAAIVALGGGSCMDTAKALALGLTAQAPKQPLHAWLREQNSVPVASIPLFCLPTTAGTGAEVTPFATIWDTAMQKKRSLSGRQCYPRMAILDPELTCSLPWTETLFGGLDALAHGLETLWNKTATPISLHYADLAVRMVLEALPLLETAPLDIKARTAMQEASCFAGLAISQSHTSLAHAISYPLTLHYGVPHGLACGGVLQAIIHEVTEAKAWKQPQHEVLAQQACAMLTRYALPLRLQAYGTPDSVLAELETIVNQDRAQTFMLKLTTDRITTLIKKSFKECTARNAL